MGYLKTMVADPKQKSVYDQIVYDSGGVERTFAEDLIDNEAVKVFAKLPGWFKIGTPLGSYNPDWAVVVQVDGQDRLYFVVETKGSLFANDLRQNEKEKMECGKAHFRALGVGEAGVRYIPATKVDDVMAYVQTA